MGEVSLYLKFTITSYTFTVYRTFTGSHEFVRYIHAEITVRDFFIKSLHCT